MSPIRVLMAVPQYPFPVTGGLERQAHELAKALIARGHEVSALSCRFAPGQASFETIDGVQVHRIEWSNSRFKRFLAMPFDISRSLLPLRHEIDLIHLHN